MSRFSGLMPVILVTTGSLLAAGAAAQVTPPKAPTPQAQPAAPQQPASGSSELDDNVPVLAVTSVEVVRSSHAPALDIVVAHGITSTDGWDDAALVPLTHGTPPDGVLDMVLTADAPLAGAGAPGRGSIQAVFPLAPDHPYKAVRIRSATNVILLRTLPGYAEAKAPAEVCDQCVGKRFVAKGAAAPAGVPAGQLVREEDLPATVRIIHPTDGISVMRSDPNRLTIRLGEDSIIVDAIWQ